MQNIAIGVLCIILVASEFSRLAKFVSSLNPFTKYQKQVSIKDEDLRISYEKNLALEEQLQTLTIKIKKLEFDRVRLENGTNILLATKHFYIEKNTFPQSLEDLKKAGYLDQDMAIKDPESGKQYYYQARSEDFVFCMKLSDKIKGVNIEDCPPIDEQGEFIRQQNAFEEIKITLQNRLKVVSQTDTVNVRSEPSRAGEIIEKVTPGQVFVYNDMRDGWYEIILNDQRKGWISGDYVIQSEDE